MNEALVIFLVNFEKLFLSITFFQLTYFSLYNESIILLKSLPVREYFEDKNEKDLLKISEIKNLLLVQIFQYKNSKIKLENIEIDELKFKNKRR